MDTLHLDFVRGKVGGCMSDVKKMGKGSMTVEAAFVIPMVLMTIFLIILLTMYVHNRAWYTATSGEALITASTQGVRENVYTGKIVARKMSQRMKKQGFPLGEISVKSITWGDQLQVKVNITSIELPGFPIWKTTILSKTTLVKPVPWIRKIQAVHAWKGDADGS